MKLAKKVIIAADLANDMNDVLKSIKSMDFINHSEVHLVHVFNTIDYGFLFGEFPLVYPVEADRRSIEESVLALLRNVSKEIMPSGFQGKIYEKCLFSDNPKSKFCDYVDDVRADMVIVMARKKRGFFESSFAQYVAKHSDANLLIMKHQ